MRNEDDGRNSDAFVEKEGENIRKKYQNIKNLNSKKKHLWTNMSPATGILKIYASLFSTGHLNIRERREHQSRTFFPFPLSVDSSIVSGEYPRHILRLWIGEGGRGGGGGEEGHWPLSGSIHLFSPRAAGWWWWWWWCNWAWDRDPVRVCQIYFEPWWAPR